MISELKSDIIKYSKKMGDKGFVPGSSGNISARFESIYLISSSGSCLGELQNEDIVMIDEDGNLVDGQKKPSCEKGLHLAIYKARPNVSSVIHAHSPKLSAFAVANLPLNKNILSENVLRFGTMIPLAPYYMPSTDELARTTAKFFDKHDVVLMANHGVIVAGHDVKDAYYKLEAAEAYAEVFINSLILRKQVELSQQDVEELLELKKTL